MLVTIPLTQGYCTTIDAEDFHIIEPYRWCAASWYSRHNLFVYATTSKKKSDGRIEIIRMHRLLLGLKTGDGFVGDHINHNTLDNRRCNLRKTDAAGNTKNKSRSSKPNGRKFKGVAKMGRRWQALIGHAGRFCLIGSYETDVEAAMAYDDAATKLHGEFARTNKMMGLLP